MKWRSCKRATTVRSVRVQIMEFYQWTYSIWNRYTAFLDGLFLGADVTLTQNIDRFLWPIHTYNVYTHKKQRTCYSNAVLLSIEYNSTDTVKKLCMELGHRNILFFEIRTRHCSNNQSEKRISSSIAIVAATKCEQMNAMYAMERVGISIAFACLGHYT